jgi:acyl-CoA reductase-like NAD-dependent aldehyde dehydrogenase
MREYKMWIGGKWVSAASGKTLTTVNPATEEEIAHIPLGGAEDVDRAVEAARQALPLWSQKPQAERSRILTRIAAALEEEREELVRLDVLEHGTPVGLSDMFMHVPPEHFEYAAQASRAIMGEVIPSHPGTLFYTQREPVGVCALITPWNVPLMLITAKLGPALAMGNTCVIKPPSIDSLTALKFAEILEKLELPPGTVNIITGTGGSVGGALAAHPGVDMISFTGSVETGKTIMAAASGTVKRLALELGGKNPFIVLEDADVETAVDKAVSCMFRNSGQICAAPGRFYIHKKLHDEFLTKFVEGAKKVIVGDPNDESTEMGPVVSAEHRDRIESYIKSGIEEGARLLLGGKRPTTPPLNKGFYVMPTVFSGITPKMTIAREEIFGPVACFMEPFSFDDEVIELANDNSYGLSASVWTRNAPRGIRLSNQIRAGAVWINDHMIIGAELPWGGYKQSGFGRENGILGLEEFTQVKLISVNREDDKT